MIKLYPMICLILFLFPKISIGQIDCNNEQIVLLRLDLKPTFQDFSIIQIECDSLFMKLNFTTYEFDGEVKTNETLKIPDELYKEFKQVILPLGIQLMRDYENIYLADGLTAEVTFLDRYGNHNYFKMRIPMKKNRYIFLVETIISLAEKLEIHEDHRQYLKIIRKWYINP